MNAIKRWIKDLSGPDNTLRNTRVMVTCGMLLAIAVALNATVSIYVLPTLRVTFGFLAFAACGYLFGPLPAMLVAALSDVIVFLIRSTGGYFPGFTVNAALAGLVYGLFLYKSKAGWARILLAQGIVSVFLHIGLNTLWLSILQGKAYIALFPARVIGNLIGYPIYVALLFALIYFLRNQFRRA